MQNRQGSRSTRVLMTNNVIFWYMDLSRSTAKMREGWFAICNNNSHSLKPWPSSMNNRSSPSDSSTMLHLTPNFCKPRAPSLLHSIILLEKKCLICQDWSTSLLPANARLSSTTTRQSTSIKKQSVAASAVWPHHCLPTTPSTFILKNFPTNLWNQV